MIKKTIATLILTALVRGMAYNVKAVEMLKTQVSTAVNNITQYNANENTLKEKIKTVVGIYTARINTVNDTILIRGGEINRCILSIYELYKKMDSLEKQLSQIKADNEVLIAENNSLRRGLKETGAEIIRLESKLEKLKTEEINLENKVSYLKSESDKAKFIIKKVKKY